MRPIDVTGIGLWARGFPGPEAWYRGDRDPSSDTPPRGLLASRIGRYTSLCTRMAVAAFEQAVAHGGGDPGSVPTVFGSAYGEVQIAFEQLDMIDAEGVSSPARFKNSVHNTAAGHVSIATGNTSFSTSIAAGPDTVAMGMLEAWAWLDVHGGEVVLSLSDESLPPALRDFHAFEPIAVAFHLTRQADGTRSLGRLVGGVRRAVGAATITTSDGLAMNPCAGALPLVASLLGGAGGTVPLHLGSEGWAVDLECGSASHG